MIPQMVLLLERKHNDQNKQVQTVQGTNVITWLLLLNLAKLNSWPTYFAGGGSWGNYILNHKMKQMEGGC